MNKNCPSHGCPGNHNKNLVIKSGQYFRRCDSRYIQRFHCNFCGKNFSASTHKLNFRHKKRREIPMIRSLLSSGVSMRRIAIILRIHRTTVKRKLIYLSKISETNLSEFRKSLMVFPVKNLQFDDLITIEHTKLKPLSVSIAVDKDTRRFIAFSVSRIPAFGHLAEKSVRKYGKRANQHRAGLKKLFTQIEKCIDPAASIESDEHLSYPDFVQNYFPEANYRRYKGGRSCIAGQGELKKLNYDPLFTLNHNFAMLRANINRLIRKTWCTTKDPEMLARHLSIYFDYHNRELV